MGDIGADPREVEFEPVEEPSAVPEPAYPQPAPGQPPQPVEPAREPVPA